jgi:hypothetical protein
MRGPCEGYSGFCVAEDDNGPMSSDTEPLKHEWRSYD